MKRKTIITIIAAILVVTSFILKETLHVPSGYHIVTTVFMLLAALVAGYDIVKRAVVALRYGIISIDLLVAIASIGAIVLGEYWEAAAVTFLFVFGDFLETKTLEKTRGSIKSLLKLAPTIVRVNRDGVELMIEPHEVIVGDLVVVKPGEKIAVDGVVKTGAAYVNTAAITGESVPLSKTIDEEVISGSVIESGYLIIEAKRVGDDTTFARILQLVEDAQDSKAKTQKFMEKFAKYYTPFIIILSIIVGLISKDPYLSLTLLVIACPGALVISVPVSIVAGIGNAARNKILFKGGDVIEKLGKIKTVAFDKTGTLTQGKPQVVEVVAFNTTKEEVLWLSTIGETYSEHPLAKTIVNYYYDNYKRVIPTPNDTKHYVGQGLSFVLEGETYLIGNAKLLIENAIDFTEYKQQIEMLEQEGYTSVFLANSRELLGLIALFDTTRADSKQLIANLHSLGIKKAIMLTGDHEAAAKHIADEVGLDAYYASLMPEDKVTAVREIKDKYGSVLMVGDGINDAPALASATLGVAMGINGTDVAIETADIILLSENINQLTHAIGISKATLFNMKTNIAFALITVSTLLAGVLFRLVDLSIGMLVHELSVLLVILNAMRLLNYKYKKRAKHHEQRK